MKYPTAQQIANEHQQHLSNSQLLAQYQVLAARKKFLIKNIHHKTEKVFEARIAKIELWMQTIWAEMERRIDRIDIGVLELLIESQLTFTLLD